MYKISVYIDAMLDENDPIDSNEESTENVESTPVESTPSTESSENLSPENIETPPETTPETAPEPEPEPETTPETSPIDNIISTEEIVNEPSSSEAPASNEINSESNEIVNPMPANLIAVVTKPTINFNITDGAATTNINAGKVDYVEPAPTISPTIQTTENTAPTYPIYQRTVITQMGDELLVQKIFKNADGSEYQLSCISIDGDPDHIEYIHTDGTIFVTFDGGLTWQIKRVDNEEDENSED